MALAAKYGPWALVAGASDGVRAAFAEGFAERGVNVVLLARRQAGLDEVAAAIATATDDLDTGSLVYGAGADPNFEPFLANPIETAEAMVHRNCTVPMQ